MIGILASILFILIVCFIAGKQEINYSFADINIGDLLSKSIFNILLLAAMATGIALSAGGIAPTLVVESNKLFTLTATMAVTLSILSCLGIRSSAITTFYGAYISIVLGTSNNMDMTLEAIISIVVIPIIGVAVAYIFKGITEKYIYQRNCHILIKNLYIKRLGRSGVVICAVLLSYNYSILSGSIFASAITITDISFTTACPIMVIACALFLTPVMGLQHRYSRSGKMSIGINIVYSLICVLAIGNILLPAITATMMPVLVSANLIKEADNCIFGKEKRGQHIINVLTIALLTPITAFIIAELITNINAGILTKAIIAAIAVIFCIFTKQQFVQGHRRTAIQKALNEEKTRKNQLDNEVNRLDVVAVTSQFNTISKEIDIKQKALINLSLYIIQQRYYLENLVQKMEEIAQKDNIKDIKEDLKAEAATLLDNIKLSKEMDQFYTQVEQQHENFVSRLQMRCSNLSERERRLAILLRLGLSSKEISSLMNIETKSVEISRYRLRKKLRLERNENIVQYLQLL